MFVQVIQGRISDAEGMRRQLARWESDLRPGAKGFLGSTSGLTEDGQSIAIVRFESQAAAEANGNRPEQTAWWNEMEKCYDGAPTFHSCTEVDLYRDGGNDKAGFVQVIQGRGDRKKIQDLDQRVEKALPQARPDLLGSLRAWDGDFYTEVAYFSSEKEARDNEQKPIPPELGVSIEDFQAVMGEMTFIDLREPTFTGPA